MPILHSGTHDSLTFICRSENNDVRPSIYIYEFIVEIVTDIVRLLFLVPLYASISFASFLFWAGVQFHVQGK